MVVSTSVSRNRLVVGCHINHIIIVSWMAGTFNIITVACKLITWEMLIQPGLYFITTVIIEINFGASEASECFLVIEHDHYSAIGSNPIIILRTLNRNCIGFAIWLMFGVVRHSVLFVGFRTS